jgi:hemoglobin-like flavoprotein
MDNASPSTPQETFRRSLARCRKAEGFADHFYRRFIDSSEEVRAKFAHTDLEVQKVRLLESLALAADVIDGDAVAMRHLHERAESHNRRSLDIQPHLYDLWLDSLIDTAKDCDKDFGSDTESAWRSVLGHIIGYMQAHYQG